MIEVTIAGIPATVSVDRFFVQKAHRGSPHTCWSDADYYGYTEIEFTVCDRRGRPAPWLEKKMTGADVERIEAAIKQQNTED